MRNLLLVLLLAVAGCAAPRAVVISAPFDAQQAQAMLAPGNNAITGSALMRQNGGGVVTCAGNEVFLIPATGYAQTRLGAIYGSSNMSPVYRPRLDFQPDPPGYMSAMRTTRCNAQGFFTFDHLADGDFFVQVSIVWKTGAYIYEGGSLIQRVAVHGGQTIDVTMAP
jgi:hypothetical protein